jgi:hypothetical protein
MQMLSRAGIPVPRLSGRVFRRRGQIVILSRLNMRQKYVKKIEKLCDTSITFLNKYLIFLDFS